MSEKDINEFSYKGEWKYNEEYHKNNLVNYDKIMYLYKNPYSQKTTINPKEDTLNWKVFVSVGEKDFNQDVVEFLRNEEKDLREKVKYRREALDMPTYKNLINAYEKVVELIKKYDWELMYSEYGVENNQKQIAIWEQNGDGIVKNHKVWNVQGGNQCIVQRPPIASNTEIVYTFKNE